VVWLNEAEAMLTTLWMNSSDKSGVSAATNRIEWLLKTNPEDCGIIYDRELRLLISSPMAVIFTIDEPNRIVRILGVQSFR